jgi:hypothetical protein
LTQQFCSPDYAVAIQQGLPYVYTLWDDLIGWFLSLCAYSVLPRTENNVEVPGILPWERHRHVLGCQAIKLSFLRSPDLTLLRQESRALLFTLWQACTATPVRVKDILGILAEPEQASKVSLPKHASNLTRQLEEFKEEKPVTSGQKETKSEFKSPTKQKLCGAATKGPGKQPCRRPLPCPQHGKA